MEPLGLLSPPHAPATRSATRAHARARAHTRQNEAEGSTPLHSDHFLHYLELYFERPELRGRTEHTAATAAMLLRGCPQMSR